MVKHTNNSPFTCKRYPGMSSTAFTAERTVPMVLSVKTYISGYPKRFLKNLILIRYLFALLTALSMLSLYSSVEAQPRRVESLINSLQSNQVQDTNRVNTLISVSSMLSRSERDSSRGYAWEAVRLSQSLGFVRGEASAYKAVGLSFNKSIQGDSALHYLEIANTMFDELGNTEQVMSVRFEMGRVMVHSREFEQAIQIFLDVLPYYENNENLSMIGQIYDNIGLVYLRQRQFQPAIDNSKIAIEYLNKAGRESQTPRPLNHMARAYWELGEVELAMATINLAIDINGRGGRAPVVPLLITKGEFLLKNQDYAVAEEVFTEALRLSRRAAMPRQKILIHLSLAVLNVENERFPEAKKQALEALNLDIAVEQQSGMEEGLLRADMLSLLGSIEKELGNHEEAYRYLFEAKELGDRIHAEEMVLRISELETIYETEKKAAQIEMLEIQNEVANLRSILIGGFGLLIILSGGFWFRAYYRKKSEEKRKRLESMQRELKQYGFVLAEKNKFISGFKEDLEEVRRHVRTMEGRKELTQLVDNIHTSTNLNDDEEILFNRIEQTNTGFFTELRKRSPDLTSKDERLATLVHMDLSNKDISNILHIEPESVKQAKRRLKKKLNLDANTDLQEYLKKIAA